MKLMIILVAELFNKKQFQGDEEIALQLLEQFPQYLTETTSYFLIEQKSQEITPINETWLESLSQLITTFFSKETRRRTIREKVLAILRSTFETYNHFYGESMLPKALPILFKVMQDDEDLTIRSKCAESVRLRTCVRVFFFFLTYNLPQSRRFTCNYLQTCTFCTFQLHCRYIIQQFYKVRTSSIFKIKSSHSNPKLFVFFRADFPLDLKRKCSSGIISIFVHTFPQKRFGLTLYTLEKCDPLLLALPGRLPV